MPINIAVDHDNDNTAAQVVIAAVTGKRILLTQIDYSFDIAPVAGGAELKVTFGAGVVYKLDVSQAGIGQINFPNSFAAGVAEAVTVDMAAGGAVGTDGQLNVMYEIG